MLKFNCILYIVGGFLGMAGGYLYYAKVGCLSGTCLITSNPIVSTLYGLVFGLLIASIFSKSNKKEK